MASFNSAFAAARKSGKKVFSWNGKKYHTRLKGEGKHKTSKKVATPTPKPTRVSSTYGDKAKSRGISLPLLGPKISGAKRSTGKTASTPVKNPRSKSVDGATKSAGRKTTVPRSNPKTTSVSKVHSNFNSDGKFIGKKSSDNSYQNQKRKTPVKPKRKSLLGRVLKLKGGGW